MSEEATLDEFVNDESDSDTSEEDLMTSLDETSVGSIPSEWSAVRLSELTEDTLYGANESAEDYDPDKPRYIRIKDIDEQGRLKESEKASLSTDKAEGYLLEEGDMLFARSGSPGRTYLHRYDEGKYCYGGYSIKHELVSEGLNHEYLSQYTKSQKYWGWIERIARTGAQANINSGEYASLLVPLPPLPEQRKIATVLYTVDRAIEKTEEILRQKETIKKGVLHHLLQTGIGESETREAKLGPKSVKFPIGWEVTTLGEVSTKMRNGFVGTATPHYSDEEDAIPYLQSFNVRENRIDNRDEMEAIEPDFHKDNPKTQLSEGDLLTVQSGHIGTSCVVPAEYDGANCHALIISRLENNRANPYFVSQFLNSKIGSDLIKSITVGTTVDHLNVKEFKNMRLPLPPLSEQNRIVETMSDFDGGIENEKQYLKRLKRLKRGLMQDLLSGTVRTTDTTIEVAEEIAQYG